MKELILKPKESTTIPIEAEVISPDKVIGKTVEEIKKQPVYKGNKTFELQEFFEVDGETSEDVNDQTIIVSGDAQHIKYIGANMTGGHVIIKGNTGMHTAAQMEGGELVVEGDVDDWAGAEMKGGLLRINGNARGLLGSAYRGSPEGMTGGCIVVGGNVGYEVASFMRRGMIVIRGDAGPFLGAHMNGGEIFVFGKTAKRAGAQAKGNGGFIACFGGVEEILPTYIIDTEFNPTFMRLYMQQIKALGVKEADSFIDTPIKRYRGDLAVGGNAELLVYEKA